MFCFTASIWRSLTLLRKASLRTGSSRSSDLTLNSNNFTPPCHHSDLITITPTEEPKFIHTIPHAVHLRQHYNTPGRRDDHSAQLFCSELKLKPWRSTSKDRCFHTEHLSVAYDHHVHVHLQNLRPHRPNSESNHIILTSSNLLYL